MSYVFKIRTFSSTLVYVACVEIIFALCVQEIISYQILPLIFSLLLTVLNVWFWELVMSKVFFSRDRNAAGVVGIMALKNISFALILVSLLVSFPNEAALILLGNALLLTSGTVIWGLLERKRKIR
ncbi:hypothetical protein JNK13_06870 [bacterium]|nr:hypothetical protein [bacterium]